ncbi:MAG: histidine kinase, partial [Proteobacteria bacterium]
MEKPEKAINEQRRLETLKTLDVLDTLPEGIFTNITFLASEICGVP